jgi:hypothetical protein
MRWGMSNMTHILIARLGATHFVRPVVNLR